MPPAIPEQRRARGGCPRSGPRQRAEDRDAGRVAPGRPNAWARSAGTPPTPNADPTPPLWRAPAVGILAAVAIILLQIASKVTPRTVVLPMQSVLTLLTGPILALFLLAILNAGLPRCRPAAAFRPAEFALIYALTTVAASSGAADEGMQLWPRFVFPFAS